MWSMLGPRPVDCFAWESFGEDWVTDTIKQLKIKDSRVFKARLRRAARSEAGQSRSTTSCSCGTARPAACACPMATGLPRTAKASRSATRPPPRSRWICRGTSSMSSTFSWQKVLGGEAAHGMLVLSPRAVARLESLHAALADAEDFPHDQGRQDRSKASSKARRSTRRRCWRSRIISMR